MVSGSPEPGWYDDYEDPALLRYWDGVDWSPHTQSRAAPVPPADVPKQLPVANWTPVASPTPVAGPGVVPSPVPTAGWPDAADPAGFFATAAQSSARSGIGPSAWPSSTSTSTSYGRPVLGRRRKPLPVVVTIVALVMGFSGMWAALSHAFDGAPGRAAVQPSTAGGSTTVSPTSSTCTTTRPLPAGLVKTLSATTPTGTPVITPAGAGAVLKQLWPVRKRALLACDLPTLHALEMDSAEVGDLGHALCGCVPKDSAKYLASRLFVARQRSFPAYFVAMTETTAPDGSPWFGVLAFRRTSVATPWQLSLITGWQPYGDFASALPKPMVDGDGYIALPDTASSAAGRSAAAELAGYYQIAKDTGQLPRNPFQPGYWSNETAAQIAEHRQGKVQQNGLIGHFSYRADPGDPIFVLPLETITIACGVVRTRSVYTGRLGQNPYQTEDQHNWGAGLAPGSYKSITLSGVQQTCFLTPRSDTGAISVLGGDYRDENTVTAVPLH